MFNEICINEEMLPKYTYILYIHAYIHTHTEDNVGTVNGFKHIYKKIHM